MISNFITKRELPRELPKEIEEVIEKIRRIPDRKEALKAAYVVITERFWGHRVFTFLNIRKLLENDVRKIWIEGGSYQCTTLVFLLRLLLVKSGQFKEEELLQKKSFIWFFSPHQYLAVKLDGNYIFADPWSKAYNIKFGDFAHGLHSGSIINKKRGEKKVKKEVTPTKEYFDKDYFSGCKKSWYNDYTLSDHDQKWMPFVEKVSKYGVSGKILDVGCAFGYFLKRLQGPKNQLFGIDISEFAIETAKKEVPSGNFQVVDIAREELPFPDNYFDLVSAFDVLEHTPSLEEAFEKIVKKVKKGGLIYISVPKKSGFKANFIFLKDLDKSHISVPSEKELLNIVKKLELTVLERDNFGFVHLNKFLRFRADFLNASLDLLLRKN